MAGQYEVRIIPSRTDFTPIVLANAIPGRAYLELNNWGTFDFKIPTLDAQAIEVRPPREVQLWRDGLCIWWGVIVKRSTDTGLEWTTVQCYGLEWYFSRRMFGPIQTNYVSNGGFESGLSNWTAVGCTATVDTAWKAKGTQSVKLTTNASGADAYLGQLLTVSGNVDQAVVYRASAVYRINPTATWNGPALYERGLYLARLVNGVVQGDDYVWEPITEDAERNGAEVFVESPHVTVPAGQTQTLDLRLYGPSTVINWDVVSVKVEESVSTPVAGEQVETLLQRVIEYAQHGAGKSELSMTFAYTTTGKYVPLRAYQFYDHGNIWESFREFIESNVCDVGVTWNTSGTARTFNVWGWPGRGTLKPGLQMDLSLGGLVVGAEYEESIEESATKVRALGQGTGATREVGEAVDTSLMDGLVLEASLDTPLETSVGVLDDWASAELGRTKAPIRTPRLVCRENSAQIIETLSLGDLVPVVISQGWIQENATRRVIGISINCESDTLEPTVN